eukprot:1675140-Pyramimonas_sp.AAC.1
MECQVAVGNMKHGRDRARTTSTEVSLANERKCEGRMNFLQLQPRFVQISRCLRRAPLMPKQPPPPGRP